MKITFPRKSRGGQLVTFDVERRFVLIGANGAGKTRLGVWLEENQDNLPVHRIGAQKQLAIPEYASLMNAEQAEKDLLLGRADKHASLGNKRTSRWGNEPATYLLSDYEKVLSLLFARAAERDHQHTTATRQTQQYVPVPDSPIDSIASVWEDLMPHCSLTLQDGKVVVGKGTSAEYHGKDMSDGERVTLYLLSQCLCAPENSVIIVDEPELHLHKSLMDKLWNRVEELCPNKILVYITHDLDFAASRADAKKLWVQNYSAGEWSWEEVPSDDTLPEALVLELIGNRKPILFCEGERGGPDHTIYQLCYTHLHVVPRGGCEKVIEATKALRANLALHTLSANGIVDRDVRNANECAALSASGVEVLAFAELENLFIQDSVVRLAAIKLSREPNATVSAVAQFVSESFTAELDTQIVLHAERRIRYHLSTFSKASSDESGLEKGLTDLLTGLSIPAIINEARIALNAALASNDLNQMLRVYNRKTLADRVSTCFGMNSEEYPEFVLRTMKSADGTSFVNAIRASLPAL